MQEEHFTQDLVTNPAEDNNLSSSKEGVYESFYTLKDFGTPEFTDDQDAAEIFINTLCSDIAHMIPEAGDEIYEAAFTAEELMRKLELKDTLYDPKNPEAWEKGLLLLAIAHRYNLAKSDSDRGVAERQVAFVYGSNERKRQLKDAYHTASGARRSVIVEIAKEAWPESNGDMQWIKRRKANNGVVVLPYTEIDSVEPLLRRIYKKLNIPEHMQSRFSGVSLEDVGLAFVWEDTAEVTVIHERRHIQFPGVRIGLLGLSLNEALTDWGAQEEIGKSMDSISRFILLSGAYSYGGSLYFLQQLYKGYPDMKKMLESRYENDSLEQRKSLTLTLINRFGLYRYLDLYLMSPNARHLGEANTGGYIDPTDLAETWFLK